MKLQNHRTGDTMSTIEKLEQRIRELVEEACSSEERHAYEMRCAAADARVDVARAAVDAVWNQHRDDLDWGERYVDAAIADRLRAEDEAFRTRDPDAYWERKQLGMDR